MHEVLFCLTIYCAQLFTQASLGNTILISSYIGDTFGLPSTSPSSAVKLPWFAAAYSLTVGSFILITGRLGDVYGHKRIFVLGFLWFGLTSLVLGCTAYTSSDIFFDVMRAAQGIGPAAILPNGVALLARVYPSGQRKTIVFALFGACAPSGFVCGAVFSSVFGQLAWWPWAFWSLAIACAAVALLAAFVVVPAEVAEPVHPEGKVDWLGAAIVVTGIIMFIYSWNEAPGVGWDKPYVYVFTIVGALLIGLFVLVEARTASPIMPLDIWAQPGFGGVVLCIALGWGSFGIFLWYMVQLMEEFRHESPLLATAQLSPVVLSGLAATMTMAFMHNRRVRGQHMLALALCAFCVGNVLLAITPVSSTYWSYMFVSFLVIPFGMDISYPAASLIVSDALPKNRQGVGASMINTVVNLSISFGLGIAGTVDVHTDKGGEDPLSGQRGANYVGVGLSGLGIVAALFLCNVPAHDERAAHLKDQPDTPSAVELEDPAPLSAAVTHPVVSPVLSDGQDTAPAATETTAVAEWDESATALPPASASLENVY